MRARASSRRAIMSGNMLADEGKIKDFWWDRLRHQL